MFFVYATSRDEKQFHLVLTLTLETRDLDTS